MAVLEIHDREVVDTWAPPKPRFRAVVARLLDGTEIQVGTAPDRDTAIELARRVIDELESPGGDWPLVGDRLLRPDAIVSIDVLRPEE